MKRSVLTLFIFGLIALKTNAQFFSKSKKTVPSAIVQKAEEFFSEGVKEYTIENYLKAIQFFEKSLEYNPNSAATYYMIAQIYNRQNNLYKSILFAQKAIKLDESNKYYHLLLAQIYYKKQDFNECAKVYANVLKKLPGTVEYNYELANIYIQLNKLEEAIKCYERIEKAFGISEDIIRQKQQLYLSLNKVDDALAQGKRLVDAFPDDPIFIVTQIEILISTARIAEAEKMANDLIKKFPEYPNGLIVLSEIYRMKGDLRKSAEFLERVFRNTEFDVDSKIGLLIEKVKLLPNEEVKKQCLTLGEILVSNYPNNHKVLAIYADIMAISENSRAALQYYLKSIRIDDAHPKIWQQICILDHELNEIDSLKVHSEKALEISPNETIIWFYNGLANQILKNYKKSSAAFEEGKKLAGNDRNLLLQFNTMLGDSYNGSKEYKKSDEAFEDALKLDVNNYLVMNNYSYYLSVRKEKLEYAKKLSERVIKDNPTNDTYLDTYAWILYMMKDYEKAKEIFEKIISKTDNGTIVEHYGDVLYQLGDKSKALEYWQKAKKLGDFSDFLERKINDKKLYE